jgi:hypothetical protein
MIKQELVKIEEKLNTLQNDRDKKDKEINALYDKKRELKEKYNKQLREKIEKKFKGITLDISFGEDELNIKIDDTEIFDYDYDSFSFNSKRITKSLANEIKALYEEYYGEPEGSDEYSVSINGRSIYSDYNPYIFSGGRGGLSKSNNLVGELSSYKYKNNK